VQRIIEIGQELRKYDLTAVRRNEIESLSLSLTTLRKDWQDIKINQ